VFHPARSYCPDVTGKSYSPILDKNKKGVSTENNNTRDCAVRTLSQSRCRGITGPKDLNMRKILTALLQWMGIVDDKGRIK
jgi:hypothetical protein